MASDFVVKSNIPSVVKGMEDIINSRLRGVGEFLRGDIVKSISTSTRGSGPSSPGQPPNADTGRLRQSIASTHDPDKMEVRVGTTLKYGFYLEMGAVVRPKKAGALSVPISTQAKRHPGGAKTFPKELALVERGSKPPLLVESRQTRTVVHYVLLQQATIAPRPFIRPAVPRNRKTINEMLLGKG